MIDSQRPNIEAASRVFAIGSTDFSRILDVIEELGSSYHGAGSLCHGDYSSDNLIVRNSHLVAAIDRENAVSCDPAHDVAYWYRWHGNEGWLEEFILGYCPTSYDDFWRRAIAHSVLQALEFVVWYAEDQGDQRAAAAAFATLHQNLTILGRG